MFFDNLTWTQPLDHQRLSPTNPGEGGSLFASFTCCSKTELQAVGEHRNSNVLNILPVTTLRTIDLAGKKKSVPLFSIFCVKLSVFPRGNLAPKMVQWT